MTDLSQAFCYWLNGTIAQNTTSGEYALPCDTRKSVSSCCLPGQRCNTQFRCLDVHGNSTAASCTQKDFNNYNCPCPKQAVGLHGTTGCADGTVCCGVKNSSCCANGQGRLSILYDNDSAMPTATSDIASYLSGYTPSTGATNRPSSASKSDTAAQASTTGTLVPSVSTATQTATASADLKSDPPSGLSSGEKAGIGIGITVGVLAIALIVGWFIIRKRNQTWKSKVNGLGTQLQRLDGNDYEGDKWVRNKFEGDAHHHLQTPTEIGQQKGNFGLVIPISATDASRVSLSKSDSPSKSELEAHSLHWDSPRGNVLEQPEQQVNELEQPQTTRGKLEQPSWPLNTRATLRHELE